VPSKCYVVCIVCCKSVLISMHEWLYVTIALCCQTAAFSIYTVLHLPFVIVIIFCSVVFILFMSLCCCHGDTVRDILMYMSLYFAEDCSLNYDQKCCCDVSNELLWTSTYKCGYLKSHHVTLRVVKSSVKLRTTRYRLKLLTAYWPIMGKLSRHTL